MIVVMRESEDLVDGEFEHVVKHAWDEHLEDCAALLNGRVGIDFDEPHLIRFINHEIIPKELEALLPPIDVDLSAC